MTRVELAVESPEEHPTLQQCVAVAKALEQFAPHFVGGVTELELLMAAT